MNCSPTGALINSNSFVKSRSCILKQGLQTSGRFLPDFSFNPELRDWDETTYFVRNIDSRQGGMK